MKKKALLLFALPALAGALFFTSLAGAGPAPRRVVFIIIDKVTWADLARAQAPNIKALSKRGAVGLLGNRTAKAEATSARSYLTIATGARADAGARANDPLTKARFKSLVELNRLTGYDARVGLLATVLKRSGKKPAVYGNADFRDERRRNYIFGREVALVGVDEKGRPAVGDTSGRMLISGNEPGFGGRVLATDYKKLEAPLNGAAADFFIFETGDTRRADIAGLSVGPALAWQLKKAAIIRADRFVGSVARRLDLARDLLIVVSPSPPLKRDGAPGRSLMPLIIAGPGFEPGLLVSPSTRRPALVAGTDIAPTVAAFFGVDLGRQSSGRPASSLRGRSDFKQLADQADAYLLGEELSVSIIFGYSAFQAALLALVVLGLFFAKTLIIRSYQAVRLAILFSLSMSLGIIVAPLCPAAFISPAAYAATILAVTAVVAVIAWLLPEQTLAPLIFVSGTTTAFIIINLLVGAPADNKSAFGYTAITAGRYYGIGNHYLSVLMPAVLIAVLLGLEKWGKDARAVRAPLAVFFAFVVFIVGYGGLGANTGGIIMTAPAFVFAYMGLFSKRPRWFHAVVAAAAALSAFVLLAVIDAVSRSEPTHLGMLARQLWGGASAVLSAVIKRKIMLNVSAFNYSHWSYAVIAVLAAIVIWQVWLRRRGLTWAAQRHPNAGLALISGITGGVIGTLANDSGIAIMAIVLGYLLMALLYLEVCDTRSS